MVDHLFTSRFPLAQNTRGINNYARLTGIFVIGHSSRHRESQLRHNRPINRAVCLERVLHRVEINKGKLDRYRTRPGHGTIPPALLDINHRPERSRGQCPRHTKETLTRVQVDRDGLTPDFRGVRRQDLRQTSFASVLGTEYENARAIFPRGFGLLSQGLQRKVHVGVFHHWGLLGGILALATAGPIALVYPIHSGWRDSI